MVRTSVLNLAWQVGHEREALEHACADADVLLVCEVRTRDGRRMDLRELLPEGWATSQDLSTVDGSMVAVCWRTETMALVEEHAPVLLSRPGRGVRARYLANVDLRERLTGQVRRYGAAHAPLAATGRKSEWYRNLRTWLTSHPRAVVGADGNQRLMRRVQRLLGRDVIGAEVMFLTLPRGYRATKTTRRVRGSDHPVLQAVLRRIRRPKKRK